MLSQVDKAASSFDAVLYQIGKRIVSLFLSVNSEIALAQLRLDD